MSVTTLLPVGYAFSMEQNVIYAVPATATVTAKTGPAQQVTAGVYTGLTGVLFLPDRRILQLFKGGDTNSPPAFEFDLTGVTTLTASIAGTSQTLSITVS